MNNEIGDMVRMKREQFAVQIRKQRREEVFRQKRIINTPKRSDSPDLDAMYVDVHCQNPEVQIQKQRRDSPKEVKQLYNDLPNTVDQITARMHKIKRLLLERPVEVANLILENEFLRILAIFLGPQFVHMERLQEICGTTLANFMGTYDQHNLDFIHTYSVQLRLIQKEFVKDLKRILTSGKPRMINTALHIFGNMIFDAFEAYMEFEREGGVHLLLNLAQQNIGTDLILWILSINYTQPSLVHSDSYTPVVLAFVSSMLTVNNHEQRFHCLGILKAISKIQGYSDYVTQLPNFGIVLDELKSSSNHRKTLAIEVVANCSWVARLADVVTGQYLQTLEDLLLHFSEHIKEATLFTLENLVQTSEQNLAAVVNRSSLITKVITMGYSTSIRLMVSVCQFLQSVNEVVPNYFHPQDQTSEYSGVLWEHGLVGLVGRLLDHSRGEIIENTLPLVGMLLDLNEHRQFGKDEPSQLLKQMTEKQIFDNVYHISNKSNNSTIIQKQLARLFEDIERLNI